MCLKLSILVVNFKTSNFENVCVELCRAEMFDVVVYDFVLSLEVLDVVDRSDTRGVTVIEDGKSIVCSGVDFGSPVRKKIV